MVAHDTSPLLPRHVDARALDAMRTFGDDHASGVTDATTGDGLSSTTRGARRAMHALASTTTHVLSCVDEDVCERRTRRVRTAALATIGALAIAGVARGGVVGSSSSTVATSARLGQGLSFQGSAIAGIGAAESRGIEDVLRGNVVDVTKLDYGFGARFGRPVSPDSVGGKAMKWQEEYKDVTSPELPTGEHKTPSAAASSASKFSFNDAPRKSRGSSDVSDLMSDLTMTTESKAAKSKIRWNDDDDDDDDDANLGQHTSKHGSLMDELLKKPTAKGLVNKKDDDDEDKKKKLTTTRVKSSRSIDDDDDDDQRRSSHVVKSTHDRRDDDRDIKGGKHSILNGLPFEEISLRGTRTTNRASGRAGAFPSAYPSSDRESARYSSYPSSQSSSYPHHASKSHDDDASSYPHHTSKFHDDDYDDDEPKKRHRWYKQSDLLDLGEYDPETIDDFKYGEGLDLPDGDAIDKVDINADDDDVDMSRTKIMDVTDLYPSDESAYPSHDRAHPSHDSAYPSHDSAYPSHDSAYPSHKKRGGYPSDDDDSGYPNTARAAQGKERNHLDHLMDDLRLDVKLATSRKRDIDDDDDKKMRRSNDDEKKKTRRSDDDDDKDVKSLAKKLDKDAEDDLKSLKSRARSSDNGREPKRDKTESLDWSDDTESSSKSSSGTKVGKMSKELAAKYLSKVKGHNSKTHAEIKRSMPRLGAIEEENESEYDDVAAKVETDHMQRRATAAKLVEAATTANDDLSTQAHSAGLGSTHRWISQRFKPATDEEIQHGGAWRKVFAKIFRGKASYDKARGEIFQESTE